MSLGMAYRTKKRCMAKGGEVKGVHKQDPNERRGQSEAGDGARGAHRSAFAREAYLDESKEHHKKVISEMRSMPKPKLMAEGGDVVSGIMRKRYSKGGMVANDVGVSEADELPAEYDELVLEDHLSGEQPMDGNEHGDDVGDDPVDRIMLKRKKK